MTLYCILLIIIAYQIMSYQILKEDRNWYKNQYLDNNDKYVELLRHRRIEKDENDNYDYFE